MTWDYFLEVVIIGVALAMDALAVSVAFGAGERRKLTPWRILIIMLFFGGFQALMPLAGWWAGSLAVEFLKAFGPWIAALLLGGVGVKMLLEHDEESKNKFAIWPLLILSVLQVLMRCLLELVSLAFNAVILFLM